MAIVISGNGIDMGNNPVSNASQVEVQQEHVTPFSGFKNYIINGNFDIWQRGNGPFTNYNYGADRWIVYNNTPIMASSTTSSNGIQKRIAHIQNVTAGKTFLGQAIELPLPGFGHPFTVGKKFTLSVRYSSTTKISPNLVFRDGAVGANPVNLDSSMTSPVYKGGKGVDEIVSWTFTVDGTAASTNTCLVLTLRSESDASHVFMYQVQLEEGSVATPFEQRPIGLELSLCQRYYQKIAFGGRIDHINWSFDISARFTTMRVVPSVTINSYNVFNSNLNVQNVGATNLFRDFIKCKITKMNGGTLEACECYIGCDLSAEL